VTLLKRHRGRHGEGLQARSVVDGCQVVQKGHLDEKRCRKHCRGNRPARAARHHRRARRRNHHTVSQQLPVLQLLRHGANDAVLVWHPAALSQRQLRRGASALREAHLQGLEVVRLREDSPERRT